MSLSDKIAGCLVGAGIMLGIQFVTPPMVEKVSVFERGENKGSVMRIYNKLGRDRLLIQEYANSSYIPLEQYFGLPYLYGDEADRNIEKAAIKKVVGWYE